MKCGYRNYNVMFVCHQLEEEMELIEQDFLEAMFEDLLKEEEEKESYYGPADGYNGGVTGTGAIKGSNMQLPTVSTTIPIIIFQLTKNNTGVLVSALPAYIMLGVDRLCISRVQCEGVGT